MAATDCSKTPRSKSIKARALTLRDHEARKLARDGRVLVVREVKPQPQGGFASFGELPTCECHPYGFHDNVRHYACPLGPVGSPLWGREKWAPADRSVSYEYGEVCYFEWEAFRCGPLHEGARDLSLFYAATDVDDLPAEFSMPDGSEIPWRSSTSMPRWASRFPHLRHESCEVKRVRDLADRDLEQTGMHPRSEEAVRMANRPPELWLWCSLVRKVDGAEVADV